MTEIFGLIGDPVEHSLSPVMHNAVFRKLGLDCMYIPFRVKKDDVCDALRGAKALGVRGLNVTHPHKEIAFRCVKPVNEARDIGAVNTILLDNKNILGYNTDWIGVIRAFERYDIEIEGKRVLIVGAGGSAKSAGYAVVKNGGICIVTNRTPSRGVDLSSYLRGFGKAIFCPINRLNEIKDNIDILINATPVGMDGINLPLPADMIQRGMVVFDMVYSPKITPLIRLARERNCRIVHGIDMLVHQGAESLRIWLGIDPPLDEMYRAIEDKIGKW